MCNRVSRDFGLLYEEVVIVMEENIERDAHGRHRQRSSMLVQSRHKKHRTSETTYLNHLQRQQRRGVSNPSLYGVNEQFL